MQPDGIGSLYLAYEQLKKKLEDEGLFSPSRKRQIPRYPTDHRHCYFTDGSGGTRHYDHTPAQIPSAKVVLYPVLVQGKGAAPSIVKAIGNLNRMGEADVLSLDAEAVHWRSCGPLMRRLWHEQ